LIVDEIIDSNVIESTEKLKSEQKLLVKQQILMYKTTVYRLVNSGITHQKQQISEKGDIARSTLTLRRCIAVSSPFSDICCF